MYQHVAHMLSLSTIETMFEDFFSSTSATRRSHVQVLMAATTSDLKGLLDKILSGGLLHITKPRSS